MANVVHNDGTWKNQDLVDKYTSTLSYDMYLYNVTNLAAVMKGEEEKMNLQEVSIPINRKEHAFDFAFSTVGGHETLKYSKWTEDEYRNPEDASMTMIMPNYGYTFAIEALGGSELKASMGLAYKFPEGIDAKFNQADDTTHMALRTYCYAAWLAQSWGTAVAFYMTRDSVDQTAAADLAKAQWLSAVDPDSNADPISDQMQAYLDGSGSDPTGFIADTQSSMVGWEAVTSFNPDTPTLATQQFTPSSGDATRFLGLSDADPNTGMYTNSPIYNADVSNTIALAGQELASNAPGENFIKATQTYGYTTPGVLALAFHIALIAGLIDTSLLAGLPSPPMPQSYAPYALGFYIPQPGLIFFTKQHIEYIAADTSGLMQQTAAVVGAATAAALGIDTFPETPTWDITTDITDFSDLFYYQMATGEWLRYTSPGLLLQGLPTTFSSLKFLPKPVSMDHVGAFPVNVGDPEPPTVPNAQDLTAAGGIGNGFQQKMSKAAMDAFKDTIWGVDDVADTTKATKNKNFAYTFAAAAQYFGTLGYILQLMPTDGGAAFGAWMADADPLVLAYHNSQFTTAYTTNAEYWNYWAANPVINTIASAAAGGDTNDPTYAATVGGLVAMQYGMDAGRGYAGMVVTRDYSNSTCLQAILTDGQISGTTPGWNPNDDWVKIYRCANYLQWTGVWQVLYSGALGATESAIDDAINNFGTFPNNVGMFVEQTVDEVLFGWRDPLLTAFGYDALNPTPGINGPRDTSEQTNKDADRAWNRQVYTGMPDADLAGSWYKYNQVANMCNFTDMWKTTSDEDDCNDPFGTELPDCRVWLECEELTGNRFSQYAWFQEEEDRPATLDTLYVSQAARAVEVVYTATRDYKGIPLWIYELSEDNMKYTADKAKYRMTASDVEGIIDIQHLRQGVPLALSQPYYGQAPEEVVKRYTYSLAEGHEGTARYDAEKHNSRIGIDPFTGRMLMAQRQLQASTIIKRCVLDSGIWDNIFPSEITCASPTSSPSYPDDRLFHAIYWVNEEGGILDADADSYIFALHTSKDLAGYFQIIFPIVGFLFLIFCVWWLLRLMHGFCGLNPGGGASQLFPSGNTRPINDETGAHADDDNL